MAVLTDVSALQEQATDRKPLWDTGVEPGSAADFARRVRSLLPSGWFPAAPVSDQDEQAPVLAAFLLGFGAVFAGAWTLLRQVAAQTRLASMSGAFLDMAAADYFGGTGLLRRKGEVDAAYRVRIRDSLVAARNTRAAVAAATTAVTGAVPRIIEPMSGQDCHAYGRSGLAAAGGGYGFGASDLRYGSLRGGQFFIETAQGDAAGVSAVAAAVARVKAAGVVAWIRVES